MHTMKTNNFVWPRVIAASQFSQMSAAPQHAVADNSAMFLRLELERVMPRPLVWYQHLALVYHHGIIN